MKYTKCKILIFAFLVILLVVYLNMVFTYPSREHTDMTRERFNSFYALPDDSLEGVMIGTSGAGRYWIPALAWKESGIPVYAMTTGNQPLFFIKYYMQEVLKYQDPKVFIIDIRAILQDPANISDADIRRTTDNMRLSLTKLNATRDVLKYCDNTVGSKIDSSDMSYFFKLAKYHTLWRDLHSSDWYKLYPKDEYMGFLAGRKASYKTLPEEPTKVTSKATPLNPNIERVLLDLLDYCDTINTPVVFMMTPYSINEDLQEQVNSAFQIIDARGYDYYNFNTHEMYKALNWKFNGDQYNKGHANFNGAVKFTSYFSNILIDKYGLEDRRNCKNESDYADWDEAYNNTMKSLKHYNPSYYKEAFANND